MFKKNVLVIVIILLQTYFNAFIVCMLYIEIQYYVECT